MDKLAKEGLAELVKQGRHIFPALTGAPMFLSQTKAAAVIAELPRLLQAGLFVDRVGLAELRKAVALAALLDGLRDMNREKGLELLEALVWGDDDQGESGEAEAGGESVS